MSDNNMLTHTHTVWSLCDRCKTITADQLVRLHACVCVCIVVHTWDGWQQNIINAHAAQRGLGQCLLCFYCLQGHVVSSMHRDGPVGSLTRAGQSSGFKLIHSYRISILNLTTTQGTTTQTPEQNTKLELISNCSVWI